MLQGLPTRAGSKINRELPPAQHDSPLIEKLEAQGAVLVGALNMGEYAYDFTGENVHDGPSRNPHDVTRMTGGSSGGSGGAVAGGLVPVALGSDTNGSIRVPSSLCGIFGLKPTYGRLSRARSFPFVVSFDHLGPFARCTRDLALSYDAMQGFDPAGCGLRRPAGRAVAAVARTRAGGTAIAVAGGYFRQQAYPEALQAVDKVAKALNVSREVELPEVQRARAAAYIITTTEGAALHLDRLRQRASDFDPAVRDRLIAGAMIPASLVVKAQKFRRWYRDQVLGLVQGCRRHPCAVDALHRARDRPADLHARRRHAAGAAQSRHLHAADLVHRLAGGGGAGAAEAVADRGTDHRCALEGRHRTQNRAKLGGYGHSVCAKTAAELSVIRIADLRSRPE